MTEMVEICLKESAAHERMKSGICHLSQSAWRSLNGWKARIPFFLLRRCRCYCFIDGGGEFQCRELLARYQSILHPASQRYSAPTESYDKQRLGESGHCWNATGVSASACVLLLPWLCWSASLLLLAHTNSAQHPIHQADSEGTEMCVRSTCVLVEMQLQRQKYLDTHRKATEKLE